MKIAMPVGGLILLAVIWATICVSFGMFISDYQIMKKPNCDGSLKPAKCDIELKLPKTYCTGVDENGLVFYYDTVVNRLYLR